MSFDHAAYYQRNKAKLYAQNRARALANPEKAREYAQRYNRTHKGSRVRFQSKLRREYGLTVYEYAIMRAAQQDACAICLRRFDDSTKSRAAHVDHDHVTKRVRGLLCHCCNTAIGHLGDNAERLRSAALYLERSE